MKRLIVAMARLVPSSLKVLILLCFFSSTVSFGIPIPYVPGLPKVYDIENAKNVEVHQLFPDWEDTSAYGFRPNCLDFSLPKILNSAMDWSDPNAYQIKNDKELYVAKVSNGFICPGRLGTVFDYEQEFLFRIYTNPQYPLFWPIEGDISRSSVAQYPKLATAQGPTLFYHWLLDRMPSIFLLKDVIQNDPEVKFIINPYQGRVPGYVHEYLDLLGIPSDRRIIGNGAGLYFAEEVYFATPFLVEPIPQKLLHAMRKTLIKASEQRPISRTYQDNLIVVIQRTERDRQIENIGALVQILKTKFSSKSSSKQYEVVVFNANTSISEQIQIFNKARLIIGVTASGLSNIIYAKKGAHVIEIHPEANMAGGGAEWVWWLASSVGLHYWVVPARFALSDARVTCPIQDIEKILQKIDL
jgi:hypothetical protein